MEQAPSAEMAMLPLVVRVLCLRLGSLDQLLPVGRVAWCQAWAPVLECRARNFLRTIFVALPKGTAAIPGCSQFRVLGRLWLSMGPAVLW